MVEDPEIRSADGLACLSGQQDLVVPALEEQVPRLNRALLPELLRVGTDAGVTITSVDVDEPNLEAVFLHLTGKALRD